ncbi:hypothetical protein TIFTF001_050571 [Ficus carica]|uniref:Uncharacterized protein n=1 Tax=Ficus carica TaxID=3494 RepID=A0AA87ZLT5_FICCA|nr:hypothetical protein TIFTF001_050570 [Ficus carica]GMN28883.1 hypothetical protein TIFTF001_050571 [Ficus carica]
MVECMSKMRLLRNLTWQKLWSNCVKTNEEVVDKLKMKRRAEPNLVEMVVQLQRQVQDQQALINNLQANVNRVEVPINPPAAQPVQDRGVQAATSH